MLSSLRLYVMASLTDRHRHAVSRVNPSSPLSPLNRFNSRKEKGKFVTDDPAFSNDSGAGSSFGKIIDNFRDPNVFHVVVVGRPMNSARVFDLSRIHARVCVRVYVIYTLERLKWRLKRNMKIRAAQERRSPDVFAY